MPITKATQNVIAPNIVTTDGLGQVISSNKSFTGIVTTTNLINETSLCFRNKIINGNFDIWQRGTSLASGTGDRFLADRFANASIGSTYTASLQLFTNGQTNVPNNPSYFHRTVVSSVAGNGNFTALLQPIESVETLAGKTAMLSFYAKADSSKLMSVEFFQNFGVGGSPSSTVNGIGVTKIALTTSWQKFTITANIPSIAGKTIGAAGDYLGVIFWFDAGSNFNSRTNSLGQQSGTFDIAQVQLEEGSAATPFEIRPIGTELALCQRYFYNLNQSILGSMYNTNNFVYHIFYPVTLRVNPTVTIAVSDGVYSGSAQIGVSGYSAYYTGTVIGTITSFTASAELL